MKKLDEALTKWEMKQIWENTEVIKVGKERGHCCVEVGGRKLESASGGNQVSGGDDKWGSRKRSGVELEKQQG